MPVRAVTHARVLNLDLRPRSDDDRRVGLVDNGPVSGGGRKKVSALRYERPKTVDAAVALLAEAAGPARVLAGGTDLLIQMRSGRVSPALLVDCKDIAEMTAIVAEDGGFRFGASTACMALVEDEAFAGANPGVTDAVKLIGSIQVKGRASVGGNLCNASPAADSVPALVVAGARVSIVGPGGRRTAAVETVPVAPGKTSLAKGEIIEAILLPKRLPRSGDAYLRFIPRTEMDIAVVSAGVNLTLDEGGVIVAARLALGAVAPTVISVEAAAEVLIGSRLDEATLERLAKACSEACRPIDDKRGTIEFRRKVAGVLAKRVAVAAYSRAGGR